MLHPPYNPGLAPFLFRLFPTLKERLRAIQFNIDSRVISAVHISLKLLPEKGLRVLKSRLNDGIIVYHLREGVLEKINK